MANLDISGIISRLCENLIYRFAPIRHEHNAYNDITMGTLRSSVLPKATSSAIGAVKVDGTSITVKSDGTISSKSSLPTVSASDNGKVLMVVNGAWAAGELPVYDGEIVTPAYNVTVALTNPVNSSFFRSCKIYEMLDIQSADYLNHLGDVLGTVDSPTGSTTVSVDGVPGIAVHFESDGYIVMDYDGVCTGDVSLLENDSEHYQYFAATGDGTVTIDRIDYAD